MKSLPADLSLMWLNVDQIPNNLIPISRCSFNTTVILMTHCTLMSTLNRYLHGQSAREGLGSSFVKLKAVVKIKKRLWWSMDFQTSEAILKDFTLKLILHCHLTVSLQIQTTNQNYRQPCILFCNVINVRNMQLDQTSKFGLIANASSESLSTWPLSILCTK